MKEGQFWSGESGENCGGIFCLFQWNFLCVQATKLYIKSSLSNFEFYIYIYIYIISEDIYRYWWILYMSMHRCKRVYIRAAIVWHLCYYPKITTKSTDCLVINKYYFIIFTIKSWIVFFFFLFWQVMV